ncbi:MAG: hypothetical protein WBB85_19160 [Albidovulum sp.]|uniref:hypothetical protein n=1 Tax=Albidovulum sp. TaxID=1872424 RepID=UPI003C9B7703
MARMGAMRRTQPGSESGPALVLVESTGAAPAGPSLSAEIAAMPMEFSTAHNLLTRGRVTRGSRLAVIGVDEAVSYACLRLGVHAGADVTACCAARHAAQARAAGAKVIPTDQPLPTCAFDAVIDLSGTEAWRAALPVLHPGGRYVTRGAVPGAEDAEVFLNDLPLFDRFHQPREVFPGLITVVPAPHLRAVPASRLSLRSTTNV